MVMKKNDVKRSGGKRPYQNQVVTGDFWAVNVFFFFHGAVNSKTTLRNRNECVYLWLRQVSMFFLVYKLELCNCTMLEPHTAHSPYLNFMLDPVPGV